jgi:hypothetical protein
MEKKENEIRKHLLIAIVIVVLGLSLTIASTGIPWTWATGLVEKVGTGLLTGGLVYGVLRYLTEDVVKHFTDEVMKQYAGVRLLGSKVEASSHLDSYYERAKEKIEVLGVSIGGFFTGAVTPEGLVEKIRKGCHVRLAFLHPDSVVLKLRAHDEGLEERFHIAGFSWVRDKIGEIHHILKTREDQWTHYKGSISIYLVQSLPYFSYFRADQTMVVGFYNRDARCNTAACIELPSSNKFFWTFAEDFASLCKKGNLQSQRVFAFVGGEQPVFEPEEELTIPVPEVGFLKAANDYFIQPQKKRRQ